MPGNPFCLGVFLLCWKVTTNSISLIFFNEYSDCFFSSEFWQPVSLDSCQDYGHRTVHYFLLMILFMSVGSLGIICHSSGWLYSLQPKMEKLYTVSKNKTWSWLWLRSWTPYCQIQLKLKKVGKTTRPFRYLMWYQIPYDYTAEVRNRLKGLDLTECLMNYGRRFMTLYRRQWSRPSSREGNANKQNGCLRRAYK